MDVVVWHGAAVSVSVVVFVSVFVSVFSSVRPSWALLFPCLYVCVRGGGAKESQRTRGFHQERKKGEDRGMREGGVGGSG